MNECRKRGATSSPKRRPIVETSPVDPICYLCDRPLGRRVFWYATGHLIVCSRCLSAADLFDDLEGLAPRRREVKTSC